MENSEGLPISSAVEAFDSGGIRMIKAEFYVDGAILTAICEADPIGLNRAAELGRNLIDLIHDADISS